MGDFLSAWSSFVGQPAGAIGAVCIMAAVTAINSRWLTSRLQHRPLLTGMVFNGLNLAGGGFLLANAMLRDEIVWIVLEAYFILIALKGLVQLRRRETEGEPSDAPTTRAEPLAGEQRAA